MHDMYIPCTREWLPYTYACHDIYVDMRDLEYHMIAYIPCTYHIRPHTLYMPYTNHLHNHIHSTLHDTYIAYT